jgi:uncharacterized membrane protein YidH (DUF202 family)
MRPVLEDGRGNERTALAWQRTALSLVAASALLSRLTFGRLGSLALLSVVVALPLALWILLEGRWRYAHDAGVRLRARSRGGRAPTAMVVATAAIAATELAALLVR